MKYSTLCFSELLKIVLLTFLIACSWDGYAQEQKDRNHFFIKTGDGFFTDRFIINGSILYAELGIKQSNNYTFSLRYGLSEVRNLVGSFPEIRNYHPVYVTKIVTIFMGYDFSSKNGKHHFEPQLGISRATSINLDYPGINDEDGSVEMINSKAIDTGPQMNLSYNYNIAPKFSIGAEASGFLSIELGIMLYYSFAPHLIVRF